MGSRCRPRHAWRTPALGDAGLQCERCGRILAWAEMGNLRWRAIVGAHGTHFAAAMSAARTFHIMRRMRMATQEKQNVYRSL